MGSSGKKNLLSAHPSYVIAHSTNTHTHFSLTITNTHTAATITLTHTTSQHLVMSDNQPCLINLSLGISFCMSLPGSMCVCVCVCVCVCNSVCNMIKHLNIFEHFFYLLIIQSIQFNSLFHFTLGAKLQIYCFHVFFIVNKFENSTLVFLRALHLIVYADGITRKYVPHDRSKPKLSFIIDRFDDSYDPN